MSLPRSRGLLSARHGCPAVTDAWPFRSPRSHPVASASAALRRRRPTSLFKGRQGTRAQASGTAVPLAMHTEHLHAALMATPGGAAQDTSP